MKDQEVIDFGWDNYIKELEKEISFVDVGVTLKDGAKKRGPTKEGKQTDITMAELAYIQEFGAVIKVTPKMRGFLMGNGLRLRKDTTAINILSRPALRQTFDEQENDLATMADRLEKEILTKKLTKRLALSELGQFHRNEIQRNMSTSGKFEANHPFTILRKGSSQPLIASGKLRQTMDYQVG